jgi:hypothetical protein
MKKRSKPFELIFESFSILMLVLISNFNYIIYSFMIIAMIQNGDTVNLVYPVSIFAYAIYEECRPSSQYWSFILLYTLIVIIFKFLFQIFPLSSLMIQYEDGKYNNFLLSFRFGIETIDTKTQSLLNAFCYNALVILFVIFHMFQLMINGLWERRETDIETID